MIGNVYDVGFFYVLVIGGGCVGVIEIFFCEECEIDLFGE